MGGLQQHSAKTAHVNLMTDTIIANLPADALRSVVRAILTTDSGVTPLFEHHTRLYLQKTGSQPLGELFVTEENTKGVITTPDFFLTQQRIRVMLGCGLCYESVPLLRAIVDKVTDLKVFEDAVTLEKLLRPLASLDGDIVQALTAVQKTLFSSAGTREFTETEKESLGALLVSLQTCQEKWISKSQEFPFNRSTPVLVTMIAPSRVMHIPSAKSTWRVDSAMDLGHSTVETFMLNGVTLPRLFSGLWQLSSPSWGVASQPEIFKQFANYIGRGFTAFDMADHYGDAEVIFGRLKSSYHNPDAIFGATKYCVFHPVAITREVVQRNVTERCKRLGADKIDLLQFHWQFYDDPQYIQALRFLQDDDRVSRLGLCNFDTQRLEHIVESGIQVSTNQVQFSLIDSRPTFKMGKACEKHHVKLLTYGTLCGGFIAEKWLDQPEPQLFAGDITPSQRKYFEMIQAWGDWKLFQDLLKTLQAISVKHGVSISNVATRWVLDFPYVGAVIIGARMGVSEHTEENLATYGWHLDKEDQSAIEKVLSLSRRKEMFKSMGDCGGEYR